MAVSVGPFRAIVSYCLPGFGLAYGRVKREVEYPFQGYPAFCTGNWLVCRKALVSARSADSVLYLKPSLAVCLSATLFLGFWGSQL